MKQATALVRNQKPSVKVALVLAIATAAAGIYVVFLSNAATLTTANVWIDTTGGTCTRQAAAADYNDAAACSSMQTALSAAQTGDMIRMKAGTYGAQNINITKTAAGTIIDAEPNTIIGQLSTAGAFYEIRNVTGAVGAGWAMTAAGTHDIILRNAHFSGHEVYLNAANAYNISWIGGSLRNHTDTNRYPTAFFVYAPAGATLSNMVVDGVTFDKISRNLSFPADHYEVIRVDGNVNGFTLKNSTFTNNNANTSTIFFTTNNGPKPQNIVIENNFFGSSAPAFYNINMNYQGNVCSNWTMRYNTFLSSTVAGGNCSYSNIAWTGNLAPAGNCQGTSFTNNVWYGSGSPCGSSDKVIASSGLGGIGGFYLQSGSGAIDAAGTGANCIATDHDGQARPAGAACDAGADEFGSGSTTPPPPPPDTTIFGPGNWPPATWRPFADSSPFNKPLPANPNIHPNSSNIVNKMFEMAAYDLPAEFAAEVRGGGGEPTYYSKSTDPAFTIHCTMYACASMEGKTVRIPAGAKSEDPTDQHLTVIDQTTDPAYEYDFWAVEKTTVPATGGVFNVASGGRTLINGSGIVTGSSATAGYFANLAGRIRAEEMAARQINHALFVVVNCSNNQIVYPASNGHPGQTCSSIGQSNTNAPAMGQHLKLNYTNDEIDALNAPTWRKTIYKAMANYGMFIGDTGSANLVSLERESDYMYVTMGHPGKWLDFAKTNGWFYFAGGGGYQEAYIGDFGNKTNPDGVDWRRLQVIDPCVSQGTCGGTITPPPPPPPPGDNLALGKPATASSVESTSFSAANAVDGNVSTRWASAYADPQSIQVDLGSTKSINRVKLNWEFAYGKSYQIQTSNDGTNWTNIYSTSSSDGGIDDLTGLTGSGRYVRMYGTVRGTTYGYSLYEFEVYGSTPSPDTTKPTVTLSEPANSATVSGTITATASATDNVGGSGVAGVQFKVDGASVGTEDTTSPYNYTLNTLNLSNGSHTISAVARDTAGNISDTATSTVTVSNLDTVPPNPPASLNGATTQPTATTTSSVALTWPAATDNGSPASGVKGYYVYRGTEVVSPLVTGTSFTETNVPVGAQSYSVRSVDNVNLTSTTPSPSYATTITAPADGEAPSVPTNLSATAVSSSQINLSWSPSTDTGGSGLRGYNLYRNGSSTPLNAAPVLGTTFGDSLGLSPGTAYSYSVEAVDGAGNKSAKSAAVSATTLSAPTALTFQPSADTFVNQKATTTNYGTATSLKTDTKPNSDVLMRFIVTGVSGRRVTGAKLRLYVTDSSSRGGNLHRLLSNTWSETSVTWSTAPAADTTALTTLGSVSSGNYKEVDVTSMITGDGTYGLKLDGVSNDGAAYGSKEAVNKPQLVVTVE